jgi:hypothetical protein
MQNRNVALRSIALCLVISTVQAIALDRLMAEITGCTADLGNGQEIALQSTDYYANPANVQPHIGAAPVNVDFSPCARRNFSDTCRDAFLYIAVVNSSTSWCFAAANPLNYTTAGQAAAADEGALSRTYNLTSTTAGAGSNLTAADVAFLCDAKTDGMSLDGFHTESNGQVLNLFFMMKDACVTNKNGGNGNGGDDDEGGPNTVAAGIAIGIVAAIFLVLGIVIFVFRRAATKNVETYQPI